MLREGRADEAIQLLVQARTSSPRDPHVPNALGLALLYKKDYPGAPQGVLGRALPRRHVRRSPEQPGGRVSSREVGRRGSGLSGRARRAAVARESERALQPRAPEREEGELARRRTRILPRYRGLSRQRPGVSSPWPRAHEARQTSNALEDFLAVLKNEPKDPVANYQAAMCLSGATAGTSRAIHAAHGGCRARDGRGPQGEALARRTSPGPRRETMSLETILTGLLESPGALGAAFLDPQGEVIARAGDEERDRGSRRVPVRLARRARPCRGTGGPRRDLRALARVRREESPHGARQGGLLSPRRPRAGRPPVRREGRNGRRAGPPRFRGRLTPLSC